MSLINRMLQELEKRGASTEETAVIPDYVRALPDESPRSSWKWLVLAGLIALGLAAAWLFYFRPQTQHKSVPPLASIAVLPMQTVTSAQAETIPPPKISATSPSTSSDATLKETKRASRMSLEIEESHLLALAEAASASVVEKSSAAEEKLVPMLSKELQHQAPSRRVKAATTTTEMNTSPVQIDKQVKQMTAQERADGDYLRAVELLDQQKQKDAEKMLAHALQQYPQHTAARQTLFGLMLESKRFDESAQLLKEGLEANRDQPGLAVALARLQVETGDNAAAQATLEKTLPTAQNNGDYVAFLAVVLQRQSKHSEAISQYQNALRLRPDAGVWWMGMGISLQTENRLAEAREAFSNAVASQSLSPELAGFVDERLAQIKTQTH